MRRTSSVEGVVRAYFHILRRTFFGSKSRRQVLDLILCTLSFAMRREISVVNMTLLLRSVGISLRELMRSYPSFCGGLLCRRYTLSVVVTGMDIGPLLGRRRLVGSSDVAMLLVIGDLQRLTSVSQSFCLASCSSVGCVCYLSAEVMSESLTIIALSPADPMNEAGYLTTTLREPGEGKRKAAFC